MDIMRTKLYCGCFVNVVDSMQYLDKSVGEPSKVITGTVIAAFEKALHKDCKGDKVYDALSKLKLTPYEAAAFTCMFDFKSHHIGSALKLCGIIPNKRPERRTRSAAISLMSRLVSGDNFQGKLEDAFRFAIEATQQANMQGRFSGSRYADKSTGELSPELVVRKAARFPAALAVFEAMLNAPEVDDLSFLQSVKFMQEFDGLEASVFIPPMRA